MLSTFIKITTPFAFMTIKKRTFSWFSPARFFSLLEHFQLFIKLMIGSERQKKRMKKLGE